MRTSLPLPGNGHKGGDEGQQREPAPVPAHRALVRPPFLTHPGLPLPGPALISSTRLLAQMPPFQCDTFEQTLAVALTTTHGAPCPPARGPCRHSLLSDPQPVQPDAPQHRSRRTRPPPPLPHLPPALLPALTGQGVGAFGQVVQQQGALVSLSVQRQRMIPTSQCC